MKTSSRPKNCFRSPSSGSYELGASAYVQKPVDFEQFRHVIGQIGIFWLVLNESPPPEVFPQTVKTDGNPAI